MNGSQARISYKGRTIGLVILIVVQFLIGFIHILSGLWLISAQIPMVPDIYSIYTLVYGILVFLFSYLLWIRWEWGWKGTIGINLSVMILDSLALLNLPTIPGIPKTAALFEIIYSLIVLLYLIEIKRTKKLLS